MDNTAESGDREQKHLSSPKTRTKSRTKKRKRSSSESSTEEVLPESTLAMEMTVCASAMKNNLDESSVKKILKKVVTNDHVLALVKLREEEEDSGTDEGRIKPKLTRSKVKELMKVSPQPASAPWNLENIELTPIKHIPVKTRPEVKALIAHDMPDEEDNDDEYHPTLDDLASDDDHTCSDLDSQPRTPATPQSLPTTSPRVLRDGPFKVPTDINPARRRLQTEEEEATIALRTRSKLSLSSTPIEQLESSFVPPDVPPLPIVDDLWNQFLEECLNPASTSRHEEDDEADPEYNVAADPDAHDEDEEALESSIIKISKKELNDLVTELFHILPEDLENGKDIQNHTEYPVTAPPVLAAPLIPLPLNFKKETQSDDEATPLVIANGGRRNSCFSIGKNEPKDTDGEGTDTGEDEESAVRSSTPKAKRIQIEVEDTTTRVTPAPKDKVPPPLLRSTVEEKERNVTYIQVEVGGDEPKMLPEQYLILQQQLRMHIQLCTSTFLQLYVHPVLWDLAPPFREYLDTLEKVSKSNPKSVVCVCNLQPALDLVRSWEQCVAENTPENMKMVKFIQEETDKCRKRYSQNNLYVGDFPEQYKQVIANSSVFLYPFLLPPIPYRSDKPRRCGYVRSEDELIALGLDEFWQYIEDNPEIYKKDRRQSNKGQRRMRWGLTKVVELMCRMLFPHIHPRIMNCHINFVRRSNAKDNPIYKFFYKREINPVRHKLLEFNPNINLYQQPAHEMPLMWCKYAAKSSNRAKDYLKRKVQTNGLKPEGVEVDLGKKIQQPEKRPLPQDFTKKIVCTRRNLRPIAPKQEAKIEIHISTEPNSKQVNPTTANNLQYALPNTNLYKVVNQATGGALLVPLMILPPNTTSTSVTSTVTLTSNPITTPAVIENTAKEKLITPKEPESLFLMNDNTDKEKFRKATWKDHADDMNVEQHCDCCDLIQKISKSRQRTVTEFFTSKNKTKTVPKCPCSETKWPKMTNRLTALLDNFQCRFYGSWSGFEAKLKQLGGKEKGNGGRQGDLNAEGHQPNGDDTAYATSFHLKLVSRLSEAKYTQQKERVESLLKHFDRGSDSPVWLASRLKDQLGHDLCDLFRDFAGFLTAPQADLAGTYRDYFVMNCVPDVLKWVDREVQNPTKKLAILTALRDRLNDPNLTSCGLCRALLATVDGHPSLAKFLFSLFPHRRKNWYYSITGGKVLSANAPAAPQSVKPSQNVEARAANDSPLLEENETENRVHNNQEYEADHSSSGEDEESAQATNENLKDTKSAAVNQPKQKPAAPSEETTRVGFIRVKEEPMDHTDIDTPELTISKTEIQDRDSSTDSTCMSIMLMSEDESIKSEPQDPWKKEEDKIILEVVKAKSDLKNQSHNEQNFEDMKVYEVLAKHLPHRSMYEIKDRVSYVCNFALTKNNRL